MSQYKRLLVALVSVMVCSQVMATTYTGTLKFKGCWADDATTRDLAGAYHDFGASMTPEKCYNFCFTKGYLYAALQNQEHCFCDNGYGMYDHLDNEDCECECTGTADKSCGCDLTNRIFKLEAAQTALFGGHLRYRGCWEDKAENRDMTAISTDFGENMTPQECFNFCLDNEYKFAGLQNKTCYCDNTFGKYDLLSNQECRCPCTGNEYKNCGCDNAMSVFEIKKKNVTTQNCESAMTCGCWGDPHCHTFDGASYDNMGVCKYDMVSTDCYGTLLPDEMYPFTIRQQQMERPEMPGVSYVEYIEIDVFDKRYKLLQDDGDHQYRFTVNAHLELVPYTDPTMGLEIKALYGNIEFKTSWGLTVTFDGHNRAEIHLCDTYAGYTCGLCGNSDRNVANDFVDQSDVAVEIAGPQKYQHFNWAAKWRSYWNEQVMTKIDIDGSPCTVCTDGFGDFSDVTMPPVGDCPNEADYTDNIDFCGIMKKHTGPWDECLNYLSNTEIEGIVNGCVIDMCMSEGNSTQQNILRCEAYAALTARCLEYSESIGLHLKIHWKEFTNCPMDCGNNEVFDLRKRCPKTCNDPEAMTCVDNMFVEGCFCEDGYVQDSDGHCVLRHQCGCLLPDGVNYLPVGDSMVSEDCTMLYKCLESEAAPVVDYFPSCDLNAYCTSQNDLPLCVCNEGYIGDGQTCEMKPEYCQADWCYGFGDPHYMTVHDYQISINTTCSYILATDGCACHPGTFEIIVDQETRWGNERHYMKSIRIVIENTEIVIGDRLYVDNVMRTLPTIVKTAHVYREGPYIVFDYPKFYVAFDGDKLMKMRVCVDQWRGLCRAYDNIFYRLPLKRYLTEDSTCDEVANL